MRSLIERLFTFFVFVAILAFPHVSSAAIVNSFNVTPTSCTDPCDVTITWDVSGPNSANNIYFERNGQPVPGLSGQQPATGGPVTVRLIVGTPNTFTLFTDSPRDQLAQRTAVVENPSQPTPTNTPVPQIVKQCNQTCGGANEVCSANLTCRNVNGQYLCRHPLAPDRGDCSTTGGNTSGVSSSSTSTSSTGSSSSSNTSTGTTTSRNTSGSSTGSTLGISTSVTPTTRPSATGEAVLGTETSGTLATTPPPKETITPGARGVNSLTKYALIGFLAGAFIVTGVVFYQVKSIKTA